MLLADRARFPRDKPCGGGLTGRAVRELPVDVIARRRARRPPLRAAARATGSASSAASEAPLVLMTQRRRLDAYLAEQAAAAGADFRDGVTVEGLTVGPDGASSRSAGRRARAPVRRRRGRRQRRIARAAGLGGGIVYGVALEGNGPLPAGAGGARDGRARRRPRRLRLGLSEGRPRELRRRRLGERRGRACASTCARLCDVHGVDSHALTDLQGRRLPMRRTASAARGPVLLVGDAAGLVDPLSGDGIYEAFVSARLAAEAILDGAARRLRARARRRARPPRRRLLEGEARARPPPAAGVRDRPPPGGLARGRRAPHAATSRTRARRAALARPPLRLLARL